MNSIIESGQVAAAELYDRNVPSNHPLRGWPALVQHIAAEAFASGALWAFERSQHALAITATKYRVEWENREQGSARVGFLAVVALLACLVLAACSSGGSDAPGEPVKAAEPVISCTSAGVCTTYPPGTTAADIERQNTTSTTPSLPTGMAYTARTYPNHYYTSESLVCLVQRADEWRGVCLPVGHHFTLFEVGTRRRISGTQVYELDTGAWRSEVREWSVVNSVLQPSYVVTRTLTSNGLNAYWRTDESSFRLEYTDGSAAVTGNAASLGGTPTGVYRRARRAKAHVVDLGAPWIPVGVDTSLTVGADGAIYGQGSDGCIVSGRALDSLEGVTRVSLTNSCNPGASFSGYAGSVDGTFYVGAIGGADTLVIAAQP